MADGVAARPTSAASASASSGTWAGCTTRCAYFARDPVHRTLPPRRADLPRAVRVHARTSCCRCRTTRSCTARARCSTRCRATTGRSSPTCALLLRATCTRSRARSCCSWAASSAQWREWNHDAQPRLAPARAARRTAGLQLLVARPEPRSTAASRRCTSSTASRRGFEWIDADDAEQQRAGVPAHGARRRRARARGAATSRRCRATTTASASPRAGGCGARSSTATPRVRRQRAGQPRRRRARRRCRRTAARSRSTSRCRRSAPCSSSPSSAATYHCRGAPAAIQSWIVRRSASGSGSPDGLGARRARAACAGRRRACWGRADPAHRPRDRRR